jgi:queuine tRNA-ribosyltransferase
LGFGKPEDVVALYKMDYTIYDTVLPTRDARHGRLYAFKNREDLNGDFYEFVYLDKGRYQLDEAPIDNECGCHTCQNYSKAYLHHLYKIGDSAFFRLATIHNLYFYMELMGLLSQLEKD